MATRATRSSTNGQLPEGTVTPEEAAAIRSSVAGKEQAPSSRQQAIFSNWRQAADQLGSPFEVEHIPVSKLRAMRRDPMLGFGLSFTKMPHVRAKWICNAKDTKGPNAQIAAHADYDLRRVYTSLVMAWMNCLDFGFQSLVKRFELGTPAGTYIETNPDTGERAEKPIWSQGNIQPIRFKPFIALPPEGVEPIWDNDGAFGGINYKPPAGNNVGTTGAKQNSDGSFDIDLYHSLWVTHERDANFGSIYGYPRLGYAYRYWWSYWFRWAIADRAFERKADPSVIVRHPEGAFTDDLGNTLDYGEYALSMGERMRSGGVIALPSDVYEDANGRGTTPMWDITFTKDATDFDPFDKSFEYLDVQKLRSLFIPEQAFFEGKGGTSSRNVAAEMNSSFIESQAVLAAQLVETINRWILPQWLAVNYPDFVANGGVVEIVMQGFSDEDTAFQQEIVQLIGQQPDGANALTKLVDLEGILERAGTPLSSYAEQQRKEAAQQQALAQQGALAPPATAPIAGQSVGVVPNSSSPTGFSYIQPQEVVYLSDTGSDFLDNLPDSPHYADNGIRGLTKQLWNLYATVYKDEYETLIDGLGNVELSEEEFEGVELADYGRRARLIINKLRSSERWRGALDRTAEIFQKIAKAATRNELKRANLSAKVDPDELEAWIKDHVAEFASQVQTTTRTEIRDFVSKGLSEGKDIADIAEKARQHFSDFPKWKADRLVRTEVRDVYNGGTLLAAQAAGVKKVIANDGSGGDTDPECAQRDGRVFDVSDALNEQEHPNGTLSWRIIPATNFSIERFERDEEHLALCNYDTNTQTAFLATDLSPAEEKVFLKALVETL